MRDYYRHARTIHLLTRTLEERLALLPPPRRFPFLKHLLREQRMRTTRVVDGFKCVDGRICAATPEVFRETPPG